jgi:hypothetical protein
VLHRSRAGNGNYVSVTGSPATVYVGGGERRGARAAKRHELTKEPSIW